MLRAGTSQAPIVRRSGVYRIRANYPASSGRSRQALLIPGPGGSAAEGRARWVLEYRSGATATDRSAGLAPAYLGSTLGVRLYDTQHLVRYGGRRVLASNFQLVFGSRTTALRRGLTIGRPYRIQGASPKVPVTVTVLSRARAAARVRVSFRAARQ